AHRDQSCLSSTLAPTEYEAPHYSPPIGGGIPLPLTCSGHRIMSRVPTSCWNGPARSPGRAGIHLTARAGHAQAKTHEEIVMGLAVNDILALTYEGTYDG